MRNIDLFDEYLNGTLTPEQKTELELSLKNDEVLRNSFLQHKKFVESLKASHQNTVLRKKLSKIHFAEFGDDNVRFLGNNNTFFSRFGRTISVAASVAVVAVLSTLAFLIGGGYLVKQEKQFRELSSTITEIKASQDGIMDWIYSSASARKSKKVYPVANLSGTCFALNNKGYLITSLHNVKGADSVFVENADGDRAGAHVVFTDNRLDIAVIKIESDTFMPKKDVPYLFRQINADPGEKVYTLGYTNVDIVYGEGSVSSRSGYRGDTVMYQISIPVNPGNSGGPLLDEQGNVVGIIRGKNAGADGVGFAVKAFYVEDLLKNIDNEQLKKELTFNTNRKNSLRNLKPNEQVKKIEPFVFNVKVYKAN